VRGRIDDAGHFSAFLPANTAYTLSLFDAKGLRYASVSGTTGASGSQATLPMPMMLLKDPSIDSDQDGLPDDVEAVIGTDPKKFSTVGDGISDGAKVQQGLDPLGGRGFPTGVIASLPLQGQARAIAAQGSTTDPSGQTLYVAAGTGGLAVVNASQFSKPILIGQLPL